MIFSIKYFDILVFLQHAHFASAKVRIILHKYKYLCNKIHFFSKFLQISTFLSIFAP